MSVPGDQAGSMCGADWAVFSYPPRGLTRLLPRRILRWSKSGIYQPDLDQNLDFSESPELQFEQPLSHFIKI